MGLFTRDKGDTMSRKKRSEDANAPDAPDEDVPEEEVSPPPDALRTADAESVAALDPNASRLDPNAQRDPNAPWDPNALPYDPNAPRDPLDPNAPLDPRDPRDPNALLRDPRDPNAPKSMTTPAPGGAPPAAPGASLEPSGMRIEAAARAMSREDKIALLSERTNLTLQESAALTPEDLDFHARAVLAQDELARETAEKQRLAAQNPTVGDPYGDDKPQHYCALEATRGVLIDGNIVILHAGQVISDRSHNVEELQKYGAKLVKCDTPEPFVSGR